VTAEVLVIEVVQVVSDQPLEDDGRVRRVEFGVDERREALTEHSAITVESEAFDVEARE
jgi:hypothetical protein